MQTLVKDTLLAPLFSEGAILQANTTVNIFGHAHPYQQVKISLAQATVLAEAGEDGAWLTSVRTGKVGASAQLRVATSDKVASAEVRFGTVILAAGQSNIEFTLDEEKHAAELRQAFPTTEISCYQVASIDTEDEPAYNVPGSPAPAWHQLSARNFGPHSAIAFYAALELLRNGQRGPIGIVECYRGGTSASCWLPADELNREPILKATYLDAYHQAVDGVAQATFDSENAEYDAVFKAYQQKKAAYMRAHPDLGQNIIKQRVGHTPWPPPMTPAAFFRPSGLYHTEFSKIVPFTFSSVIWYQGENDAPHPHAYTFLLAGLINRWRASLKQPQLPFYVVQLPQYNDEPVDAWPLLRMAQAKVARELPNVHLVSIVDTGERHNIHPTDKRTPGTRIGAVMAKAAGYCATPQVQQITTKDVPTDGLRHVAFCVDQSHQLQITSQLEVQVLVQNGWRTVTATNTTVTSNKLTVDLPANAVAVRYCWDNAPVPTLYNEVGYPVSPFSLRIG
ncbi:sialate O-acetylesterase [uncultured Lacticaseibacillus sp.]|uniref:sialate O-acetylesterase n=1 Tax=uncultured Lacticaseibacillus sp. TaxID=2775882 RepID=UPI0025990A08|nr:sialate O-acetylesterase [uncultured Lacticaseibacillus sp.]